MGRKIVVISPQIVQDVYDPATPNEVLCCECQNVTFVAQNTHSTTLHLSDILGLTGIGTEFTGTLLTINGVAPSYPLALTPGQTFTFEVNICSDTGIPDGYIKFDFSTTEFGNEGFYYVPLHCVDMQSLISPQPIDFGSVTYGASGSQNITITNTTIGQIDWNVAIGSCEGHNIDFTPSSGTLAPSTSTICVATWTPAAIDEVLGCLLLFNFCKYPGVDIEVLGTAAQDCSCLCCNNVTISTEENLLRDIDGLCGTTTLVTSTIADKKLMNFEFSYQNGISDGLQIWFNPILFAFVCDFSGVMAPPSVGWFVEYDNTMTDGIPVPMTLIGAGTNSLNQKNFEVFFVPLAATDEFEIHFNFLLVADFETLINATTFSNNIKFKRNVATSLTDWTNILPSVYNTNKRLCSMIYLKDPNTIVDGQPFECFETNSIKFSARWYNKGLYNGASEFNSPSFQLSRAGGSVANFSTIEKTQVTFQIIIPSMYTGCSGIILQLFDESQFDNSIDFLTNYDSSRALIPNLGSTTTLDNHFNSPSSFLNVSPGVWQVTCFVDTAINPSSTYRIAAIVYAGDTITANTFLSEPIQVTEQPDPDCGCVPSVKSYFDQVFQSQETNCLRPAPKERIQHRLILDSGDFKDCLESWGALVPGSNWRDFLKRITLTIYKRASGFPTAIQTTFFVYSQHVSNRVAGFPGGWQNLNDLIVQDTGSAMIETSYLTRVRWEQSPFTGQVYVAPTLQYLNRTNAGALSSTYISTNAVAQSWIDEDVFLEYRFEFDLSSVFGAGFNWNIVDSFKVKAIDFENDNSSFSSIIGSCTIEGISTTTGTWIKIEGSFCPKDYTEIRITYSANQAGDFVFFLEKSPFGLPYIQESEVNTSPFGIPLSSIPGVISQGATFGTTATINFDPSIFDTMNEVNVCGYISTPAAILSCSYFDQFTRLGGSSAMTMPGTPQTGGNWIVDIINATNGKYLDVQIDTAGVYPVPGQTYYFEYTCSSPLTKPVKLYFGEISAVGTPVTIPVGATTGSLSFIWGSRIDGRAFIQLGTSATNLTSTLAIKIGEGLCP